MQQSHSIREKNKYNFSQKHTVLESGKVKHEFFLKPKKNGKNYIEKQVVFKSSN